MRRVASAERTLTAARKHVVDSATRANANARSLVRARFGPQPQPTPPPHALVSPPNPPGDSDWQNMTILVDKPQKYTSFDVVARVRRMSRERGVKKVGHCGTLDPMATGLLILCTGKATKIVDTYQASDKTYTGTIRLGEGTPSQDADTEVNEREPWEHVTDEALRDAAAAMHGASKQTPPMYSALKVDGKRLYQSAREGVDVERKQRDVFIHKFEVERDAADAQAVHFMAECSKGTYVRTLALDLCKSLGTTGHLTALRRTKIGEYSVEDAWTIESLAVALGDDPSKYSRSPRPKKPPSPTVNETS